MDEYRSADFTDVEVTDMDFRGYAAVFDTPWNEALIEKMGYVESVARGAFRKALTIGNNVPLLWQHERRDMLATTKSGNLKIREDGKGLLVEAKLPRNPLGEYVRSMIEAGDVRGMSYGIATEPGKNRVRREGDRYHRRVTDINRIIDTTLTWEPAYEATTVELRAEAFTAAPLQELVSGLEEQTDDAAPEAPPVQVSPYQGRMADVLIEQLERGGVLL
jgi:HK97 family phage prohead protease